MSINDIIEKQLDDIRSYMNLIYGSIEYLDDYGYVGLHSDDILEEDLINKAKEVITLLTNANNLLEDIGDIVKDQFEY